MRRHARREGVELLGVARIDPALVVKERIGDGTRVRVGVGKGPRLHSRPMALLPGAKSVIIYGLALPRAPLENLPITMNEYDASFIAANSELYRIGLGLCRLLENRGARALQVPIEGRSPSGVIYMDDGFRADISLKHYAAAAGMGTFGLASWIITPEFGPRVRLGGIVTDAGLRPGQSLDRELCNRCGACAKACPVGAISSPSLEEIVVARDKCYHRMFRVLKGKRCGLCIGACLLHGYGPGCK